MNEKLLITNVDRLKNLMSSVSTGGVHIQAASDKYLTLYEEIEDDLSKLGLENPNPYQDIWEWSGRWNSGDLPTYQSRRDFLNEMYNPLLQELNNRLTGCTPKKPEEPTGWPRVDRTMGEIRKRLAEAKNEEQFQAVGLLCRETIISLAQAVYDPQIHPEVDGIKPSETDAKRMLESYISYILEGPTNKAVRRHAKAAYSLTNDLQHHRTANFRQAALCVEATSSIVNVIAIISGQRDPE